MFKNKKIFIVLLLIAILLTFSVNCFAATGYNYTIGTGTDNASGYSVSAFNDLVLSAQNDSRVTSGEYYYFVSYNYGDRCINSVLVKKSACDSSFGHLNASFWNEFGYYHYILNISSSNLSNSDIVYLNGRNALKSENSSIVGLSICSDSDNVFYLATNYDKNIYCDSSCEQVFIQAPVQEVPLQGEIAPKLEGVEITQTITTTLAGLAKLLIPFLICLLGFYKGWKFFSTQLHKA